MPTPSDVLILLLLKKKKKTETKKNWKGNRKEKTTWKIALAFMIHPPIHLYLFLAHSIDTSPLLRLTFLPNNQGRLHARPRVVGYFLQSLNQLLMIT